MRNLAIIQARCGSSRLPNKVMLNLGGKTVLEQVIMRVQKSTLVDEVVVATSIEKDNLPLIALCVKNNIRVFVGSEEDVLDRYYQVSKLLQPEYVIRITADCPLFDPFFLNMAIQKMEPESDYLAALTESFPDGLDIEIMRFSALKRAWKEANMQSEREHVTLYFKNHPELFCLQNLECPIQGISDKRWTVDEPEDYEMIQKIYQHFESIGQENSFASKEILAYLEFEPEIECINQKFTRNEGLAYSLERDKKAVRL